MTASRPDTPGTELYRAVAAMADAVLALTRDPQRRLALGAAARARALAEWHRDAILGAVERQRRALVDA